MRLLALALLAAATALANESSTPVHKETLTSGSIVSPPSEAASSPKAASTPTVPDPTPVGELWTAKWTDETLAPYTRKCESSAIIKAEIYNLSEIYPALKKWAPELKIFYNKQLYPGSWDGEDKHGTGRELLKMDFEELPFAVREWLQRNPKQRHFNIQDDVVFFAPGAIYPILPLWVDEAEDEGESLAECEGEFIGFMSGAMC